MRRLRDGLTLSVSTDARRAVFDRIRRALLSWARQVGDRGSGVPRMRATVDTVRDRLGAGGGLLYRYCLRTPPSACKARKARLLLCWFWWRTTSSPAAACSRGGSCSSRCARVNYAGLLAEQIDPVTGAFLGNFPLALSQIGLISTVVDLARHTPLEDR